MIGKVIKETVGDLYFWLFIVVYLAFNALVLALGGAHTLQETQSGVFQMDLFAQLITLLIYMTVFSAGNMDNSFLYPQVMFYVPMSGTQMHRYIKTRIRVEGMLMAVMLILVQICYAGTYLWIANKLSHKGYRFVLDHPVLLLISVVVIFLCMYAYRLYKNVSRFGMFHLLLPKRRQTLYYLVFAGILLLGVGNSYIIRHAATMPVTYLLKGIMSVLTVLLVISYFFIEQKIVKQLIVKAAQK